MARISEKPPLIVQPLDNVYAVLPAGLEARLARAASLPSWTIGGAGPEAPAYTVTDGVATVPVHGFINRAREEEWFGDTSMERVQSAIERALADPAVSAIELDVDSPGGVAMGIPELAAFIAGASKPMSAFVSGMGCSAAYWLAAATGRVETTPSALVGSIGVVYVHDDVTGMLKEAGVSRTYITAGEFKAVGAPRALSEADRETIQGRLDHTYDKFVQDVARGMGVDPARRDDWANGRVFFGDQALEQGLVSAVRPYRSAATITGRTQMTLAELCEKYPEQTAELKRTAAEASAADQLAARDREVLAIVAAVCGEAAADRVGAALSTGMSAEQLMAAQKLFAVQAAPERPNVDVQAMVKAELSRALAGAEPVTAGAPEPKTDRRALIEQIGHYGQEK